LQGRSIIRSVLHYTLRITKKNGGRINAGTHEEVVGFTFQNMPESEFMEFDVVVSPALDGVVEVVLPRCPYCQTVLPPNLKYCNETHRTKFNNARRFNKRKQR
jgi:hypothetical protein